MRVGELGLQPHPNSGRLAWAADLLTSDRLPVERQAVVDRDLAEVPHGSDDVRDGARAPAEEVEIPGGPVTLVGPELAQGGALHSEPIRVGGGPEPV